MPKSARTIDMNTIRFDTEKHGGVAASAHAVKKGFSKDGSDTYFCKFSKEKQASYSAIASILAEKWYGNFALISETRPIHQTDSKTGCISTIGFASVGLKDFTDTKIILDTFTQGKKKLTLHGSDNIDLPSVLSSFNKKLDEFLKKYKHILHALENPSSSISDDLYRDFDSGFDVLFSDNILVAIGEESLTFRALAYSMVCGKAGMDVALMLYPDGDNHQCNNGISKGENDEFHYSKIDHDYSVSRLKALMRNKPIPDELKCKMSKVIISALLQGNPVPLQITRRFDPSKSVNLAIKAAHIARMKYRNGAKTTTSKTDAFLTRAIQLRHRKLYQQEVQKALSSAVSVTVLSTEETRYYQDTICLMLTDHVSDPRDEAEKIVTFYIKFLSENQNNLKQMNLIEYQDFNCGFNNTTHNSDIRLFSQISSDSSIYSSGYESENTEERNDLRTGDDDRQTFSSMSTLICSPDESLKASEKKEISDTEVVGDIDSGEDDTSLFDEVNRSQSSIPEWLANKITLSLEKTVKDERQFQAYNDWTRGVQSKDEVKTEQQKRSLEFLLNNGGAVRIYGLTETAITQYVRSVDISSQLTLTVQPFGSQTTNSTFQLHDNGQVTYCEKFLLTYSEFESEDKYSVDLDAEYSIDPSSGMIECTHFFEKGLARLESKLSMYRDFYEHQKEFIESKDGFKQDLQEYYSDITSLLKSCQNDRSKRGYSEQESIAAKLLNSCNSSIDFIQKKLDSNTDVTDELSISSIQAKVASLEQLRTQFNTLPSVDACCGSVALEAHVSQLSNQLENYKSVIEKFSNDLQAQKDKQPHLEEKETIIQLQLNVLTDKVSTIQLQLSNLEGRRKDDSADIESLKSSKIFSYSEELVRLQKLFSDLPTSTLIERQRESVTELRKQYETQLSTIESASSLKKAQLEADKTKSVKGLLDSQLSISELSSTPSNGLQLRSASNSKNLFGSLQQTISHFSQDAVVLLNKPSQATQTMMANLVEDNQVSIFKLFHNGETASEIFTTLRGVSF